MLKRVRENHSTSLSFGITRMARAFFSFDKTTTKIICHQELEIEFKIQQKQKVRSSGLVASSQFEFVVCSFEC
jgi:hypothetical protein